MNIPEYNKLIRQRMTAVNPMLKAALTDVQKNGVLEQIARTGIYQVKVGGRTEALLVTIQVIADAEEQDSP